MMEADAWKPNLTHLPPARQTAWEPSAVGDIPCGRAGECHLDHPLTHHAGPDRRPPGRRRPYPPGVAPARDTPRTRPGHHYPTRTPTQLEAAIVELRQSRKLGLAG